MDSKRCPKCKEKGVREGAAMLLLDSNQYISIQETKTDYKGFVEELWSRQLPIYHRDLIELAIRYSILIPKNI